MTEMDRLISAVAWPASLILNMVASLPPIGVVLSSIVSILAIIHYILQIRKAFLKKDKDEE
jgi:uncharacterized membrane protein